MRFSLFVLGHARVLICAFFCAAFLGITFLRSEQSWTERDAFVKLMSEDGRWGLLACVTQKAEVVDLLQKIVENEELIWIWQIAEAP